MENEMNVPALIATHQLRQREYLLRITRAMTSRLDLPSLLELILNSAAEMASCRVGLIALAEETEIEQDLSTIQFQFRTAYGIPPHLLPAFAPLLNALPNVQNDEGESLDLKEKLRHYFSDLQQRAQLVQQELNNEEQKVLLHQVIGLPLLFENDLLGIIYLFRGDYAFTQVDWQLLQGFAYQAAIAVRNARLYRQLNTERNRLETIIENSANGIMILDTERRVVVINQALASMLGLPAVEAVGQNCQQILVLDNVQGDDFCQIDPPQVAINRLLREGNLRCEGDLPRPGAGRITLSVVYTPLLGDDEQVVNIIVNVHDITRYREEEEVKSTFASIISHELKTPVALIKGFAQTLARPDAEWNVETARQGLQVIEEEADRLELLINNLLDISRIQAEGLRLDYADVDLNRLVARVVKVYRTQSEQHELAVRLPEHLPLVWGDEERLRQVLTNLIGNAIKYSPNGGEIRLGGWTARGINGRTSVVLYVADEGIGIPSHELPHIFERFYRIDSSLRRSTAGTGLGLFLARKIVEAHGGQIWARSEVDRGTTFFFSIPAEQEAGGPIVLEARPTPLGL